jgi:hypothetical protein
MSLCCRLPGGTPHEDAHGKSADPLSLTAEMTSLALCVDRRTNPRAVIGKKPESCPVEPFGQFGIIQSSGYECLRPRVLVDAVLTGGR